MNNKNKEPSHNKRQTPEEVKRFYNILIKNGETATSRTNPQLFNKLNGVGGNMNLPTGVAIGKYWQGPINGEIPDDAEEGLGMIAALALGEVADPKVVHTGNRTPGKVIGMLQLSTIENQHTAGQSESSFFSIFDDGSVVLEQKYQGLGSEFHKAYLNDFDGLAADVTESDFNGTNLCPLTDSQRGAVLATLETSVNNQPETNS